MTKSAHLENQLSAIRKYLDILKRYQAMSKDEIVNDVDKRGAVERYLYLAVQAAIDVAESVVAYKDFRKATTMGDAFVILAENGIIEESFQNKLVRMVGFRNVIAHEYDEIDYDILYVVLQESLQDIEQFRKTIEQFISSDVE